VVLDRALQKLFAVLGAFGVLSLAVLPAEHVHVAQVRDGHHAGVVHRHYEPHHAAGRDTNFTDDDHDIHWLDSSFTSPQPTPHQPPIHQLLNERPQLQAPEATCRRTARLDSVSVHDPPPLTPSGLRAPPPAAI
jgi:hypothetical protein